MKRAVVALTLAVFAAPVLAVAQDFDLLLRNGRIVDGTGAPWFAGDLAIRGDTIVAVGPRLEGTARRVIDVGGHVVAPGFIDIHTHARRGIYDIPGAVNYARQGVTTLFEGPDGSSPLPIGEFLSRVAALPPGVNFGTFFGHGSVREAVLGNVDRAPTAEELERMKAIAREAMRDGAFGMSTGLFYVPGAFARTDEVIALARVVGELGGIHISHMRDEAAKVVESVRETIAIGEEGRLPTQITHHKIIGGAGQDRSRETLRLVEDARARGVDATIDQYPYTASSTSVAAALLPAWALEGGADAVKARLADAATRARIREVVLDKLRNERGGGDARNIQIATCRFDPSLAGKNLDQITRERGRESSLENAAEVAMDLVASGGCQGIFHAIPEADVVRILASPFTMIGSDGEIPTFGKGSPHPRSYGTFVRVLGVYVREKRLLGLEEAVRRMTSFPAARLGLADRGLLRPGMKADIAVFDPATVRDTASFERPHQYAEGVPLVLVNGVPVVEAGSMTGARPGQVLFGPATAGPAR
jgi:dihydroorotase/N-acyl-D-amino-acid deacylase